MGGGGSVMHLPSFSAAANFAGLGARRRESSLRTLRKYGAQPAGGGDLIAAPP